MDAQDHQERLIGEMEKALEAIPGIEPSFSQPIRDNMLESISQIDGQVVIKVFGDDIADAADRDATRGARRGVARVRGVARAFIDRAGQVPQLQIEVDRAARGALRPQRRRRPGRHRDRARRQGGDRDLGGRAQFGVVVRLREDARRRRRRSRSILIDTPRRHAQSRWRTSPP